MNHVPKSPAAIAAQDAFVKAFEESDKAKREGDHSRFELRFLAAQVHLLKAKYELCIYEDLVRESQAEHDRAVEDLKLMHVRPLRCLGMECLARFIEQNDPLAEEARAEWSARFGHEFPVYAIAGGVELKITP